MEEFEEPGEKKSIGARIKEVFTVAYGKQDEDDSDIITKNKVEVPVEIGMQSDYYTQVSGTGIKEGVTVVIKSEVEPDNPLEQMMMF